MLPSPFAEFCSVLLPKVMLLIDDHQIHDEGWLLCNANTIFQHRASLSEQFREAF